MEDLYKVGDRVAQETDPMLAELLAGAGGEDIQQYLQNYEHMLQQGLAPQETQLNEVDAEGGITVRPEPGFVVKTRDTVSGMKVFLNIVSNEHVEAPHMKSFAELEGEEGCRVPLSVGTPVEDFDKKHEPCVTYDIVANPEVVENCSKEATFRDTVVQLCLAAVAQKYKVELDTRYKLPKVKYKGAAVQLQRLRKQKQSQIQEVRGPAVSAQGAGGGVRDEGDENGNGPKRPDFCIFYAASGAQPLDGFAAEWGPPPENESDAAKIQHIYGLDLPCYRVNAFQERIRGTMRNLSDRHRDEEQAAAGKALGESATREVLVGRTCVVQVKMPDLDRHIAALKQFSVDISDECLRVTFPLLPRTGRVAYAPLTIWWPSTLCSAQATADWEPRTDTLTVALPTEQPREAGNFDPSLLDAVF